MTKAVYALLVGVNEYLGEVPNLRGCKQDITEFDAYLEGRVGQDGARYESLLLTDERATRQNVIDAFRDHLGKAQKNDQVLFYFSGHGSRAKVPQDLAYLEPDGFMETLVLHDSRQNKVGDLVDKELGCLLYDVGQNGAEITVVLDCCHSGTGTRSDQIGIRQAPDDELERSVDDLLFMQSDFSDLVKTGSDVEGRITIPKTDHVLLAACLSQQFAKELPINGTPKGIFSYFLLDSLKTAGHLTYRDLYMRVNALVKARVSEQSPQLESDNADLLSRPFLGGTIQATPSHFTVSYHKEFKWVVDAGAIHGIVDPRGDETTRLALFPFDATAKDLHDLTKSTHTADIVKVMATQSQINLTSGKELYEFTTYKAVIIDIPIDPLLVLINGDAEMVSAVDDAIGSFGIDQTPSILIESTKKEEMAALWVGVTSEGYKIFRSGEVDSLVSGKFVGDVADSAQEFRTLAGQLEHIARWQNLLQLHNPSYQLDSDAVRLHFEVKNGLNWERVPADQEIVLNYQKIESEEGGETFWQAPEFRMALENVSKRRLFCMLFDLTDRFKIISLTESDGEWLDPGELYWLFDKEALEGTVPDELWSRGQTSQRDTLKLLVTTEESYARRLEQDTLPEKVHQTKSIPEDLPQPDTLSRLMHRVNTRELGRKKRPKKVSDWYSTETSFTTNRPAEAKWIRD